MSLYTHHSKKAYQFDWVIKEILPPRDLNNKGESLAYKTWRSSGSRMSPRIQFFQTLFCCKWSWIQSKVGSHLSPSEDASNWATCYILMQQEIIISGSLNNYLTFLLIEIILNRSLCWEESHVLIGLDPGCLKLCLKGRKKIPNDLNNWKPISCVRGRINPSLKKAVIAQERREGMLRRQCRSYQCWNLFIQCIHT